MKTKTNSKILLVIAVLLIISCIFNISIVNATETAKNETNTQVVEETTPTPTAETPTAEETATSKIPDENTLKSIDDEWTVKAKEIQFKEMDYKSELLDPITKSLQEKGFDMTKYEVSFTDDINYSKDIHKREISIIEKNEGHYKPPICSKQITIKYSNSDSSNYNINDEKIVKEIANGFNDAWYSVSIDEKLPDPMSVCEKAINDLIPNKDVKCIVNCSSMSMSDTTLTTDTIMYFFKNDICYMTKEGSFTTVYQITIPENIRDTEEAYINYSLPKIKEKLNDLGCDYDNITLSRQNNNSQWYDIYTSAATEYCVGSIVIKKENAFMVTDGLAISSNANVSLSAEKMDSTSSHYTDMQKVLKDKGYNNVLDAFEIKLSSGNIENGLELTFDVGTEYNGKQVMILHQKQDGTYEEFEKTVENGRVKITVTELSPFMIALKGDRILDNEPKTGVVNYTILASVVTIISLGGLAVLKFKK